MIRGGGKEVGSREDVEAGGRSLHQTTNSLGNERQAEDHRLNGSLTSSQAEAER